MSFVRSFVAVLAVLVLTVAAGYAWISRDRAPTHEALASAKLSPLIPLRDFWANQNSEWGYRLSAEGSYLSWWSVEGANTILNVKDRSTGAVQIIRPTDGQSASYEWSHDDRSLFLQQFQNRRWSVWKIDATNVDAEWAEVTPRGFTNWRSLHFPRNDRQTQLITTFDRSREFQDVYAVDQDGFGKELVRRNPGNVTGWKADENGEIYLRTVNTGPGEFDLQYDSDRNDSGWRSLIPYTSRDALWLAGDDGKDNILAVSNIGREYLTAVRIDLATGSETVLFEDISRSIADWHSLSRNRPKADIVEIGGGYPEYVALTPLGQKLLEALEMLEEPFNMNVLSATSNGELVTLAINEQENGWHYLLVDTASGNVERLGEHDFTRHAKSLAETEFHQIEARDGLTVPILLTRPNGVKGATPMVAMIHGGPMSHDRWYFNQVVQFLANRGYAVLRVNYRGSTGFGRSFQRAGDHEYGRKMQDDIQDAVQWAIDNGMADKDAIAIMGASFGGYSAMMGLARDPGFFAAGVSVVGAVDLEHQTIHAPHFWGVDKSYWTQVMGDPDNSDDVEAMREFSPINHVDRISDPILLAAGINDPVVDRAVTERFARRLEELGKEHEAYYYEKEGHGFRRWQTNVRFYRTLEDFLAKHLGGRSGGFDYVEIGAEYLYP